MTHDSKRKPTSGVEGAGEAFHNLKLSLHVFGKLDSFFFVHTKFLFCSFLQVNQQRCGFFLSSRTLCQTLWLFGLTPPLRTALYTMLIGLPQQDSGWMGRWSKKRKRQRKMQKAPNKTFGISFLFFYFIKFFSSSRNKHLKTLKVTVIQTAYFLSNQQIFFFKESNWQVFWDKEEN